MKRLLSTIVLLLTVWACLPSLVSAHAYVSQSTPYQDAELKDSPASIRITFTEKIDTGLSSISLQNSESGSSISGTLSSEGDVTLIYTIPKLDKGIYKVSWQALSLDSHTTEGSFRFAVGMELEQKKPDDAISLDGASAKPSGPIDNGSSTDSKGTPASKPSNTDKGTEQPIKIEKPAAKANPTPSPSAEVKPLASQIPNPTSKPDSAITSTEKNDEEIALDEETAAAIGNNSSGVEEQVPPSTDLQETTSPSNETSAAAEHVHTDEGEHNHAGGYGLMVVLRVFDILAGVVLAGVLFFRYMLWRQNPGDAPLGFSLRSERLLIGAAALVWVLSGLTRLYLLSEQFGGLPLYTIATETLVGKIAVVRPVLALLVLLLAFAPVREQQWANPVKLLVVTAIIVTFPLTGHAYASVDGVLAAVVAHACHMLAAAVWFGGLLGLLSLTFYNGAIMRLNRVAQRFSVWAVPSMALILASGIWLSATRLTSWAQLATTDYGKLIVGKTGFMLLVLLIAALHKLLFMPRIAQAAADLTATNAEYKQKRAASGLILGVRIEVLLAIVLFILAGWLSQTSPPEDAAVQQQASEPFYWHVMGEKAHMSLRVSVGDSSEEQQAKLDIWLPEGTGAPLSIAAIVSTDSNKQSGTPSEQTAIPFELQPAGTELYEFPDFTKYTYRAQGVFIDYSKPSKISIDVTEADGSVIHYEKVIGE
ncbi:putative copper export protein/methionine-rich copper-binding protein CopC [Paenibacillus castaneae]|uniref:copper resistance CopC/CopD family protein n=1 Tax=Paenibacillus castaneae TaxID=474957 RepID=UPI00141BE14B|nr:copper resistance protein CopC [Paenibacillus castaneae]NIK80330.1 putative copper export protein/methionine-rich copper-binding protein CopC [Paenibacillus castaneae]